MVEAKQGLELNKVFGHILQGLTEAKRLGDMESVQLYETYKANPVLSQLSVPAFDISEVEVELRFTVVEPAEEAEKEGGISGLKVRISAPSLEGLESHQIQTVKLRINPVLLRVVEESK